MTGWRRLAVAFWAAAVDGCGSAEPPRFWGQPPFGPEIQSVIYAVEGEPRAQGLSEATSLIALPRSGPNAPLLLEYASEPQVQLTALAYPFDLTALDVQAGVIERPLGDEPTRPLPAPVEVWRRREPGEASWQAADPDPELLRRTIRSLDPFRCLGLGRCPSGTPPSCLPCVVPRAPLPPTPPEPPQPPRHLGCGTRSSTTTWRGRSLRVCEPRPPITACPPGQLQPPDLDHCLPLAPKDPARWPSPLPAGPAYFIDPQAALGGDGSEAAPYRTINEGLANTPAGAVLVLAAGVYPESVALSDGRTLIGVGAADTHLVSPAGPGVATVSSATLVGLTVAGDPALAVGPGGTLTATAVILTGARGLVVEGTLQATELWIDQVSGRAAEVSGRAELTRVVIRGAGQGLLVAGASAELLAEGLLVQGSHAAILIREGGRATLSEVVLEDVSGRGLGVEQGTALVNDLVIRDRLDPPQSGRAVQASQGVITGERWQVLRGPGEGLMVELGGRLEAVDVEVNDQGVRPFLAESSGHLTVRRARGARGGLGGIWLTGRSEAVLADLELIDCPRLDSGHGLMVESAKAELTRARIVGGMGQGITTAGVSAELRVSDLAMGPLGGTGLTLAGNDDVVIGDRLQIRDTEGAAVVGTGDTFLEAREVLASGARSTAGRRSATLSFNTGAEVQLETFLVENNRIAGLDIQSSDEDPTVKRLRAGLVRNNAVGLLYRADLEDFSVLLDQVVFQDNELLLGVE